MVVSTGSTTATCTFKTAALEWSGSGTPESPVRKWAFTRLEPVDFTPLFKPDSVQKSFYTLNYTLLKTTQPLWPPKPKFALMAMSTFVSIPLFGV